MASRVDSSGLSVITEEKSSPRKHHDMNHDQENVNHHKVKSAYGTKKKMHPLMFGPSRQVPGKIMSLHSASKNNLSEFTQRIMSAKLLRVKQVQNQLNETQQQLNELINENKVLRNMQKRQEGALRRYEGNYAELPQLIRSHNEEIRTLKANNKLIKAQLRESNTKLKERENELENLRDNYTKLKKLSKEKNLLEREKLQKKVEDLQEIIKEQEGKIQVLSRKILLESKNYRHHLNVEVLKHKETQKDLNSALTVINKLESQLLAKDKFLPGGKTLLKRESKTLVPVVSNKSMNVQPKVGTSEDSFLSRHEDRKKISSGDSPESELELLQNIMGSSDDTPSPTQDIFPEIMNSRKSSLEKDRGSDRLISKADLFDLNYDGLKKQISSPSVKRHPLTKKSSKFTEDIENSAKALTEKINEKMDNLNDIVQKAEKNSSIDDKSQLGLLYDEVKENKSKLESEINSKLTKDRSDEKIFDENEVKDTEWEEKRSVPKRKFDDNKNKQLSTADIDFPTELTEAEQQNYLSMNKTWNDLKDKIQQERKKAEEKIKELNTLNGLPNISDSLSSDSDTGKPISFLQLPELGLEDKKELRFVNFTNDAYILQELEKTDKVFNKLKSETKKKLNSSSLGDKKAKANSNPKLVPKPKPKQQDVKNFRTESRRDPKYLEEFQSEYQKQNLIKALKAIDDEKDPNFSTEESGESEPEVKNDKFYSKSSHRISAGKNNKDLLNELFGSKKKLGKSDNIKFECPTVAEVNE